MADRAADARRLAVSRRRTLPVVLSAVALGAALSSCSGAGYASSATSTTATLARCAHGALGVTADAGGMAGLGHAGVRVVYTNRGATACSIVGYPSVVPVTAAGRRGPPALATPSGYLGGAPGTGAARRVVVLAHGARASSIVEGTDVPVGSATSCPSFVALLVAPPGGTAARLAVELPGCSRLLVHPVVAGASGQAAGQ